MNIRNIPSRLVVAVFAAAAAAGAAAQQVPSPSTPAAPMVIETHPVYTRSMQRLQDAAQQLRESIQAMAHKPPGPDRDRAIHEAQQALLRTQTAMTELPPEMRSWGSVSDSHYDESVRKLMAAADDLRQSVQAMADRPAGARLDEAIRSANQALLDTQTAMAGAYELQLDHRSSSSTHAAGASGS